MLSSLIAVLGGWRIVGGAALVTTPPISGFSTTSLAEFALAYVTAGTAAAHENEEYMDTTLGYRVKFDGVSKFVPSQKHVGGAASVTTTGAAGAIKDRIQSLSAVTTRQRISWPAGKGPKHIIISVNHVDFCKVCFNAQSPAVADAFLAQGYDGVSNVQHRAINSASPIEEREFIFGHPLETLDFLPTTNHTELKVLGV